jgi:hypothetical protein
MTKIRTSRKIKASDLGFELVDKIGAMHSLIEKVRAKNEQPEAAVLMFLNESSFISASRDYWGFMYDIITEMLPLCKWENKRIKWGEMPWDAETIKDPDAFCKKFVDEVIGPGFDLVEFLRQYRDDARGGPIALEQAASRASMAKHLGETPTVEVKPKGGNYNPDGIGGRASKQKDCLCYHDNIDNKAAEYVERGTSSEYLAARIARDRPDIQEKMKQGQYPSVRAAAIDAGIVKPRVKIEWKADATPEMIAAAIRKKVPPDMLSDVIQLLTNRSEGEICR